MKRILTLASFFLFGFIILPAYIAPDNADTEVAAADFSYSKKVNAIVQEKCYGCHSVNGKSDKAKEKLMWDDVPGLSAGEQGEKLDMILEVLKEGAMPPARFLEGNPDKKLTEKETATMEKWANKTAKKIAK